MLFVFLTFFAGFIKIELCNMFQQETSFWKWCVREALENDVNALESKIVKLNVKIASIKRKHNPDKKSLSWNRTSDLRCSKCEGYGHETQQCPNWHASPINDEDLIFY